MKYNDMTVFSDLECLQATADHRRYQKGSSLFNYLAILLAVYRFLRSYHDTLWMASPTIKSEGLSLKWHDLRALRCELCVRLDPSYCALMTCFSGDY